MSDLAAKFKKSKRIAKTGAAVKRQQRIAKAAGVQHSHEQPHRYAKMHSLNCGIPKCPMCGNPRTIRKEKTIQEEKFLDGYKMDKNFIEKY
jgi:hypothetical protein